MPDNTKGLSLRDSRIIELATKGYTAEQIGAELSIPPIRVVAEVDRLTKSMDWLTELQRLKLATRALWSLIGEIKDLAESGNDEKMTKNYLEALKIAFDQVDRQRQIAGADIERVEAAHARVFVEIIEKSFYHALGTLTAKMPDLPKDIIEEQFKESLSIVAADYDSD